MYEAFPVLNCSSSAKLLEAGSLQKSNHQHGGAVLEAVDPCMSPYHVTSANHSVLQLFRLQIHSSGMSNMCKVFTGDFIPQLSNHSHSSIIIDEVRTS